MAQKKIKMLPEKYRMLLKEVEFSDIRLMNSTISLNLKEDNTLPVKIRDSILIEQIDDNQIQIFHTYTLTAKYEKSNDLFIKIAATFQLIFNISFEFDEEFFDIYKNVSLPLNTFPFFREYVFNTTARMNIPPLTLPLLIR